MYTDHFSHLSLREPILRAISEEGYRTPTAIQEEAIPLALAGALYTSQFMHPGLRGVVKPVVEVMAALPSVVLGFIAVAMAVATSERGRLTRRIVK